MPKEVERLAAKLKGKKGVHNAWAVAVAAYKKRHGGKAPNMHPHGSKRGR